MRSSRRPVVAFVALTLVTAAAGGALAHGLTGRTEPVEVAVDAAVAALSAQPPVVKRLRTVQHHVHKPTNEKSFANELKSMAAASKAADPLPSLPETDAVKTAFANAAAGYVADLALTRDAMDLALTAQNLDAKVRAKILANRGKLVATLALTTDATPTVAIKTAVAGTKSGAGFTPYDDGGAYAWVISSMQNATSNAALDLDGDKTGDNALGQLASALAGIGVQVDLNAVLLGAVQTSSQVVVIELWNVQKFQSDTLIFGGVLAGMDTDADTSDNFNGSEVFSVTPGSLAADGNARVRAASSIKNGQYEFRLKGQAVSIAGIPLPSNAVVAVRGTATALTNSGTIGMTIPTATLLELLDDAGITIPTAFQATFLAYADIDLDGNGSKDAFSANFTFGASPASFAPTAP